MTFEEEIEKMKKESEILDTVKFKTELNFGGLTTSFEVPVNMMFSQNMWQKQSEADLEEENRYLAKQEMKQRHLYE